MHSVSSELQHKLQSHKPKKYLGQHFLTAPLYLDRICAAIPQPDANGSVVEIGPGKGCLSLKLKERFSHIHCIEVDKDLCQNLRDRFESKECTIHEADVLDFNFMQIESPLHVVGNLPYNIAALIIKKTLLLAPIISSVTYMVQREVATRIVAEPHTKDFGFLSLFCGYFGTPKILFHVPAGAFFPKPKVESSVFQLQPTPACFNRLPMDLWPDFFRFITQAFSTRRKTLVKNLTRMYQDKTRIVELVMHLGIPVMSRPEDLCIDEWISLFLMVSKGLVR